MAYNLYGIMILFLVLIFAANYFDDELFYSVSRKKNSFRLFEKSWFIIQMAYWLSTAIRNLQVGSIFIHFFIFIVDLVSNHWKHLIEKFTKQIDCDHSTTPFIYLFFSVYAYTSDYHSGGMLLISSHYITDLGTV